MAKKPGAGFRDPDLSPPSRLQFARVGQELIRETRRRAHAELLGNPDALLVVNSYAQTTDSSRSASLGYPCGTFFTMWSKVDHVVDNVCPQKVARTAKGTQKILGALFYSIPL